MTDKSIEAIITAKTPKSICSNCGNKLDAATGLTGSSPNPGDISICLYCHKIMVFDKNLKLRNPRKEEMPQIIDALEECGLIRP